MDEKNQKSSVKFKHKGKVICEYQPFQDMAEVKATVELLAYEKGVPQSEIYAEVELCGETHY